MEREPEAAWPHFVGWRINYEQAAYAIAAAVDAVPALWSGPRRWPGAPMPPLRPMPGVPFPSAASGNVCPVNDAAEPFIVGVVVAPDDVSADHAALFFVGGVVGAIEGEVAQRGELCLDAVQPG